MKLNKLKNKTINKIKEKYYYYVYKFYMNLSIYFSAIATSCRTTFVINERKYKEIKKMKGN